MQLCTLPDFGVMTEPNESSAPPLFFILVATLVARSPFGGVFDAIVTYTSVTPPPSDNTPPAPLSAFALPLPTLPLIVEFVNDNEPPSLTIPPAASLSVPDTTVLPVIDEPTIVTEPPSLSIAQPATLFTTAVALLP